MNYIYCFVFLNLFFALLAWENERLSRHIFKQRYNINKLVKEQKEIFNKLPDGMLIHRA